jgi:hypothetical protein
MVFEKEYIMGWKVECLEMMPSWCGQVNWETVGFPE